MTYFMASACATRAGSWSVSKALPLAVRAEARGKRESGEVGDLIWKGTCAGLAKLLFSCSPVLWRV